MSINTKKLKRIRRFGRLRFAGDIRYQEKVLLDIYEKADPYTRTQLDDEMEMYFEAINNGKLKPGDSILKLAVPEPTPEVKKDEVIPQ